jgi:hypothetical protein
LPRQATFATLFCGPLNAISKTTGQEAIMGVVMIKCPAVRRDVSTGIEMCDLGDLPLVVATMSCPACGRIHEWTRDDAWLADGGDEYRQVPYLKVANG